METDDREHAFDQVSPDTGHINGTACAFFYSTETLTIGRSIPSRMMDIFGLQACKTALINMILAPKCAPQHFISGTGFMPTRLNALFYGGEASGKNLLVQTFCAEQHVNLIIVSYAGLDVPHDMPLICAKAMSSQPCVIMWDDCTVFFRQQRDPRIIGTFQTAIRMLKDSGSYVWNIFTTVEKPHYNPTDPESLHHAFYSSMKLKFWSGDNGSDIPLTQASDIHSEADRVAIFDKAIGRYCNPESGDPAPFSQEELARLAGHARFCTAGNIISFIDDMYLAHADRIGLTELVGLTTNSSLMMPTFQMLETTIRERAQKVEGAGITHFNAHQVNIVPYSPAFENMWD